MADHRTKASLRIETVIVSIIEGPGDAVLYQLGQRLHHLGCAVQRGSVGEEQNSSHCLAFQPIK